ncbi:hypothetical protein GCM10009676_41290 [Prauserella halophila]|uniref:Uncharacterized protein n=1 Tax=Prauserella halophila TaxID=185641 RepID=A0ABP4H723_9PSEU
MRLGTTRWDGSSDAVSGVRSAASPSEVTSGSEPGSCSCSVVPVGAGSSPESRSGPSAGPDRDEEEGVSLGTRRMLQAATAAFR